MHPPRRGGRRQGVLRRGLPRTLHARGIKVVIPEESDTTAARTRRGPRGGRPPSLGVLAYRSRNVVERHFLLTKQWRGLATRLAITYRAAIVLAARITWSRI